MVSLDDAVIARYKHGEHHFEVLVDPYDAADLIDGKEINIPSRLLLDVNFKKLKKEKHTPQNVLNKI